MHAKFEKRFTNAVSPFIALTPKREKAMEGAQLAGKPDNIGSSRTWQCVSIKSGAAQTHFLAQRDYDRYVCLSCKQWPLGLGKPEGC